MNNLVTIVISATETILRQVPFLAVFSETFKLYSQKKFDYFLDEVKKGIVNLDFDTLNEYDILHNAYLTQLALLKIRQREKIKLLANLFISYCNKIPHDISKNDYHEQYELFINIIESITMNEWNLLLILYNHEFKNPPINKRPNNDNWNKFLVQVKIELNFEKSYIEAILSKLNGSGLYQTIVGTYNDYEGNQGYLTPIYYQLIEFLDKSK